MVNYYRIIKLVTMALHSITQYYIIFSINISNVQLQFCQEPKLRNMFNILVLQYWYLPITKSDNNNYSVTLHLSLPSVTCTCGRCINKAPQGHVSHTRSVRHRVYLVTVLRHTFHALLMGVKPTFCTSHSCSSMI